MGVASKSSKHPFFWKPVCSRNLIKRPVLTCKTRVKKFGAQKGITIGAQKSKMNQIICGIFLETTLNLLVRMRIFSLISDQYCVFQIQRGHFLSSCVPSGYSWMFYSPRLPSCTFVPSPSTGTSPLKSPFSTASITPEQKL